MRSSGPRWKWSMSDPSIMIVPSPVCNGCLLRRGAFINLDVKAEPMYHTAAVAHHKKPDGVVCFFCWVSSSGPVPSGLVSFHLHFVVRSLALLDPDALTVALLRSVASANLLWSWSWWWNSTAQMEIDWSYLLHNEKCFKAASLSFGFISCRAAVEVVKKTFFSWRILE